MSPVIRISVSSPDINLLVLRRSALLRDGVRGSHASASNMAVSLSTGTYKVNYGVGVPKKDFGLYSARVALPESERSPPSNYNQTMPGYSHEQKLEQVKTTFPMDSSPTPISPTSEGEGKAKSSWTKKMRGLFKSGASGKRKAGESAGEPRSVGSSPSHPSPQQRVRSSTWSHDMDKMVLTRPLRTPEDQRTVHEGAEAGRIHFQATGEPDGRPGGASGN